MPLPSGGDNVLDLSYFWLPPKTRLAFSLEAINVLGSPARRGAIVAEFLDLSLRERSNISLTE